MTYTVVRSVEVHTCKCGTFLADMPRDLRAPLPARTGRGLDLERTWMLHLNPGPDC